MGYIPAIGKTTARAKNHLLESTGRDFLSDVHFTDLVNFASVRSTYCACAMVVGAGVGVVIGVHVVHMHFMMEYTLMETSKSRSWRLASQGNPSPSPPQG